jgi:hypothetical protein
MTQQRSRYRKKPRTSLSRDEKFQRAPVTRQSQPFSSPVPELRSSSPGPRGETFLALGAESDGTTTLGLSFREGCAGESRVWFQLLELDTSGTLEATTEPVVVDDGDRQDQRRPTMAWWDASSEWLVVYQRGLHQVVGRRFDDSARLVDDSLPPLLEVPEVSSGTRQALAERSVAFALSDGERIGMVGYIPGDEASGLWGARLGCGL